MLPGAVLCMIREKHIILKAVFHSRLASYIIMLYCLVYSTIFYVSLGNLNYSYSYLASFPISCIVHNCHTMIMQVYY